MKYTGSNFSPQQLAFQELFIGTLIYVAVLGLFNQYTTIVYANNFSTILFASVVLQILTYAAFWLKGRIVSWLKDKEGKAYRILMFFCVWMVMFTSKFVFIWVLDIIFGAYIRVNGFFGILLVVACVTLVHRVAYQIFHRLGPAKSQF